MLITELFKNDLVLDNVVNSMSHHNVSRIEWYIQVYMWTVEYAMKQCFLLVFLLQGYLAASSQYDMRFASVVID